MCLLTAFKDLLILFSLKAGKVEFRIVTYTPNEWPEGEDGVTILTEEESSYFKNLVMGLLVSLLVSF